MRTDCERATVRRVGGNWCALVHIVSYSHGLTPNTASGMHDVTGSATFPSNSQRVSYRLGTLGSANLCSVGLHFDKTIINRFVLVHPSSRIVVMRRSNAHSYNSLLCWLRFDKTIFNRFILAHPVRGAKHRKSGALGFVDTKQADAQYLSVKNIRFSYGVLMKFCFL